MMIIFYQMRALQFEELFFVKNIKWNEFPYCGICYKKNENADDRNEKLLYFSNKPSQIVNSKKCIMS